MALTTDELRQSLKGLFSFPVTAFTAGGDVDLARYHEHLQFILLLNPRQFSLLAEQVNSSP